MTESANPNPEKSCAGDIPINRKWEMAGLLALIVLGIYFLKVSWRKWPDPVVDAGTQWYAFWQLSHGALLYHDIMWNYGPLSAFFDAALFRIFGPGMMVLAIANIIIFVAIVGLVYVAVRRAWGRLAAFAGAAVFICAFGFSHQSQAGNYNYALPYAQESTHGILLILVTAFVAARWRRGKSLSAAFALGLCGGLATVLKPEFMLAGAVAGIAALALRYAEKERVTSAEFAMLLAGVALPTLLFAAWFVRVESLGAAFIDASRAWWMVLIDRSQLTQQQAKFSGLSGAGANILLEFESAGKSLLSLALIWAAGWAVNRPWKPVVRMAVVVAVAALLWFLTPVGGWYSIGRGFLVLILMVAAVVIWRVVRQVKQKCDLDEGTAMALFLVLLAVTMLARMPLFPRIYHLGFFQAALAGIVLSAFIVAEIPRWVGKGGAGHCVSTALAFTILSFGCVVIAKRSSYIGSFQTQVVGEGRDRFYAFEWQTEASGYLVEWAVEQLKGAPPDATLVVLPEGLMVNYLSRRSRPVPTWNGSVPEEVFLQQLRSNPPGYVVLVTRDLKEFSDKPFGSAGAQGEKTIKWVYENYLREKKIGGDPINPTTNGPGAEIYKRK